MSSKKPEVSSNLKAYGYDWIPQTTDEVGKDLADVLKKHKAECFVMDVYATGNRVYRNIACIFEEYPGMGTEEELRIRYDRDTGKNFVISKEIKKK